MICRKDSLSYVVFIRGLYTRNMLPTLATRMTRQERINIKTMSFQQLWDGLWEHNPAKNHIKFRKQFERAKSRFERRRDWEIIFENNPTVYLEPEWGFPKGRGNKLESPLHAAVREFCEETQLTENDITLETTNATLVERYTASDSKEYEIHYYLAKLKDVAKDLPTVESSSEVSKIAWFTCEEGINKIRSYNVEKIEILRKLQTLEPVQKNEKKC